MRSAGARTSCRCSWRGRGSGSKLLQTGFAQASAEAREARQQAEAMQRADEARAATQRPGAAQAGVARGVGVLDLVLQLGSMPHRAGRAPAAAGAWRQRSARGRRGDPAGRGRAGWDRRLLVDRGSAASCLR